MYQISNDAVITIHPLSSFVSFFTNNSIKKMSNRLESKTLIVFFYIFLYGACIIFIWSRTIEPNRTAHSFSFFRRSTPIQLARPPGSSWSACTSIWWTAPPPHRRRCRGRCARRSCSTPICCGRRRPRIWPRLLPLPLRQRPMADRARRTERIGDRRSRRMISHYPHATRTETLTIYMRYT